jgi:hypothetical protein
MSAPRTVVLVWGIVFPRYKEATASIWQANKTKRIRDAKAPAALSTGACRDPAEAGLKFAADVLLGSFWRRFALRVAVQKLRKNPELNVILFDIDRGLEERVVLQNNTLSTVLIRKFLEPLDSDYRVKLALGNSSMLKALEPKLLRKDFPDTPQVRLYPFISEISAGPVEHAAWLAQRAQNPGWLAQYGKRAESSRLLGIHDVYGRIQEIGVAAPYTLEEFQLWGHASSSAYSSNSGTAFANTDHVQVGSSKTRHPLDLDARAIRDFDRTTMDRRKFRMAFARGALTIVWGCNWSRPYYDVLGQVMKQLGSKPLKDDTPFVLSWRRGTGGPEGWFRVLLGLQENDPTKNIKKDGKFIRALVTRLLGETYMQQLANVTSRCVIGGVPGVGSDYDERSEKKEPCLSNIPMAPLYGMTENMRHVLNFYAAHFGVQFHRDGADPKFGRGFALYCPDL